MTLIFALNTGKELYLASDGLGFYRKADGTAKFLEVEKYIKVNDNVEILFSGVLDLARRYYHGVQQDLWGKGGIDEQWSSYLLAKTIEKEIAPTYEGFERTYNNSIRTPEILKMHGSISAFLRRDWPLEIFVCGMDKDVNGNLSNPRIYVLNNKRKYIAFEFNRKIALSGAPDVEKMAEPIFIESRFLSLFDSPTDIKNEISSCYKELIQRLKNECPENSVVYIGEPIHIARINKEGYEVLR